MSRIAWLLIVAVLGAAQALLRPAPEGGATAAESSLSVLGAAVRPVFVALTWAEADAALDDRRVLDALDHLRVLEKADPAAWEASVFRAHIISHNLADRERGEARADRIVEAVRVLEAAGARSRDPGPDVAIGQLLLEHRMGEPDLHARLEKDLRAPPSVRAAFALETASRKAPGSDRIARLLMEAARQAGLEALVSGRSQADALAWLDRAGYLAARDQDASPGRELAVAWAQMGRSALGTEPGAVDAATHGLVAALGRVAALPGHRDDEAVIAARFAHRAISLAEVRAAAGDDAFALSLLGAVHTIRSFVQNHLDRSHLTALPGAADQKRALSLLDRIGARAPAFVTRVSALRTAFSAW